MTTFVRGRRAAMLSLIAGALIGGVLTSLSVPAAHAHEYKAGDLVITHPWTRATPKGASVAGGFLRITNTGKTSDRLIGGSFTGAGRVEVHEMSMTGGVMKMRELAQGLEIKPGQTIELKPGSYHMMFMQLGAPIPKGESVKGTLKFDKAGTVAVDYRVEDMGARSSNDATHKEGGHGGHGKHQ